MIFRFDACGIICIALTYLAILYADYVIVFKIVVPNFSESLWGVVHVFLFNCVVLLLTMAHLQAVFSDPGIVPLPRTPIDFSDVTESKKKSDMVDWTVCVKCESYRPPRAYHCRICKRCIRRMDHHCPWVNNCVGEFNQKYFLQFLFYTGILSLYSLCLVIAGFVYQPPKLPSDDSDVKLIHCIALTVESVLFGLFVIAIGCDQMQAVCHDETAVEHVKRKAKKDSTGGTTSATTGAAAVGGQQKPVPRSAHVLLSEVFGNGTIWCWLCPCHTSRRRSLQLQYMV